MLWLKYISPKLQRECLDCVQRNTYFLIEVRENKVPLEKRENVQEVIKTTLGHAEEAGRLFQAKIEELRKDKYCQEIMSNILDKQSTVNFESIVGLYDVKKLLQESLIMPSLRPDLFTGLRSPPRGILFYGPPGNGKTFLAKAVSCECKATFFAISASAMVSKWVGDSEKMMRALFEVARAYQPSIIFVDEIDSLLSERKDNEQESSRRLKTEFLVQFDGVASNNSERVTLIGATNLPNNLDLAALRRFEKRIFIPLPDLDARAEIIKKLIRQEMNDLTEKDLIKFAKGLEYYSASDITNLIKEAAMEPLREFNGQQMMNISKFNIRPITYKDLEKAKKSIMPSVTKKDVDFYTLWEKKYSQSR